MKNRNQEISADHPHVRTISVGTPRDVDFNGQIFRSAILKTPVAGPVYVSKSGIEGNKPAVHPDAVYAISAESYEHWHAQLDDSIDWRDGFVGENLTIVGLDQRELAIGDLIGVGSEVVLQVLGPRIPCFKLAWRLGQPNSFLTEFALSGHCGFYLQVLQEGTIQAGDSLKLIESDKERILLSHISELIFGSAETVRSDLERVLAVPFLSETSAFMLRGKLARHRERQTVQRGRWKGWRPLVVTAIREETDEVRSIYLAPPSGEDIAGYLPGQFLTLRLNPERDSEVVRTYTISDYSAEENYYRISVKREQNGRASGFLHEKLDVGSSIDIKAPSGRFVLDQVRLEPVVFISAGIGITPVLSMAKAHAERGDEAPLMLFVHCAESTKHQVLRAEIDEVCARSEKFRQHYVVENVTEADVRGVDYHYSDRINVDYLRQVLGEASVTYCGTKIVLPFEHSMFYLCGPEGFQDTFLKELEAAGVPPENIRTESFSATKGDSIGDEVERADVILSRSGKSVEWQAEDNLTLLELLEENGIDCEFGCRNGLCQSCKCHINFGDVHYDRSPNPLPEEGTVLVCCAKPGSAELHLDL